MGYVTGITGISVVWQHRECGYYDQWFLNELRTRQRIGPRFVADRLKVCREEAKSILSDAAGRGIILSTPDGWYRAAVVDSQSSLSAV